MIFQVLFMAVVSRSGGFLVSLLLPGVESALRSRRSSPPWLLRLGDDTPAARRSVLLQVVSVAASRCCECCSSWPFLFISSCKSWRNYRSSHLNAI